MLNELHRANLSELSAALDSGTVSSRALAKAYLDRIAAIDRPFRSVLCTNPDALTIAHALDEERADQGPRSPLHGIPIMVKDNLDTGDRMPTTAGSLALAGTHAAADSTVVARLRAAGALILGKTNLSEWANFRSTRSCSGWSSAGGQTGNAFDPARTPGGSSSGSGAAVALGLCAAAIGTETDGSIVLPAAMNGIVGLKPSIGLVSRRGIVPIAASQDTAGPMARSVSDAALLLDCIAGPDPADPATTAADANQAGSATSLPTATLAGKRLGVARNYLGYHVKTDRIFERILEVLRNNGAVVIDHVDLPSPDDIRAPESILMNTEFKSGLAAYLATRQFSNGPNSVDDVIAFNLEHAASVMPHFGQERLLAAAESGPEDSPHYLEARACAQRLAREDGIDAALNAHQLDAVIAPTTSPAWLTDHINGDSRLGGCSTPAAVAGYPHITVPMGFVEHLPVGISFFAGAHAEKPLLELAYCYEQLTGVRRAPPAATGHHQ